MSATELVIVCALELLGRSASRFPPFHVLEQRPPAVSANADAFVDSSTGVIYVIASAPAFHAARSTQSARRPCGVRNAVKLVASILVHEEWHLAHGPDENGAYSAQLTALSRLGLGPGTPEYGGVQASMQTVAKRNRR